MLHVSYKVFAVLNPLIVGGRKARVKRQPDMLSVSNWNRYH